MSAMGLIEAKNESEAKSKYDRLVALANPTAHAWADNRQGTHAKRHIWVYVEDRGTPIGMVVVREEVLPNGGYVSLDVSVHGWFVTKFQFHYEEEVSPNQWVTSAGQLHTAPAGNYYPEIGIHWIPGLEAQHDADRLMQELKRIPVKGGA
jgi:hypothetical protein